MEIHTTEGEVKIPLSEYEKLRAIERCFESDSEVYYHNVDIYSAPSYIRYSLSQKEVIDSLIKRVTNIKEDKERAFKREEEAKTELEKVNEEYVRRKNRILELSNANKDLRSEITDLTIGIDGEKSLLFFELSKIKATWWYKLFAKKD